MRDSADARISEDRKFKWRQFLTRWSCELLQTKLAERLEPAVESSDWLGFDGANEKEIADLERRLGVILPPSYKAFLRISNGWRRTTAFIGRIRGVADVNWFRVENENWADIYSEKGASLPDDEYYDYPDDGANDQRAEHMKSLLQISDVEDGVYLLNPEAVAPDGEWEAWFFASWIPGARRFASFEHLMIAQYRSFANIVGISAGGNDLPTVPWPAPDVPRVPAERVRKGKARAPSLEALIEQLGSAQSEVRTRAVRTFNGKLKGRPRQAARRADLVQSLSQLFYSSPDHDVRATCVQGITELAEDGTPPGPLFDALSDRDAGVVLSGIFALSYFPDPRACEPLCRFVDSGVDVLFSESAMSALGQLRDERAVPTLEKVLLDTSTTFDQRFGTAAIALAQCGSKGMDALLSASRHGDARVRRAAAVGLDVSGDPRGTVRLDEMESDPDDGVRARAKIRMGNFYYR